MNFAFSVMTFVAALSKDISVGNGGILTSKASSQTLRTGNIMNVQDLSNAYKLSPGQLLSFKQLVLAGDDGSTNIYEVCQDQLAIELKQSCVALDSLSNVVTHLSIRSGRV